MDDIKIKAFEDKLIELCNKIQISNRAKYYVLRDVADKVLEASERDIAIMLALANRDTTEKKGGEE